jgi:hypothetical protein
LLILSLEETLIFFKSLVFIEQESKLSKWQKLKGTVSRYLE